MKGLKRFVLSMLLIGTFCFAANGQQFTDTDEAIAALGNKDWQIKQAAIDFLAENPQKSVSLLKKIIEEQKENWIWAMSPLNKASKEDAVSLYIKLLGDNFYLKEKDGTRKIFGLGSKNGCLVQPNIYGRVLAKNLGWLGNKLAIPVLKEALKQGDIEVRTSAFYALYELDYFSLQNLFDLAKQEKEVDIAEIIMSVGWKNIHSNNELAIKIFDRIIEEFPNDKYKVASAHFWKIQCFELLQMLDKALLECDEVLKYPEFVNLTEQVVKKKQDLLLKLQSQSLTK